MTFGSIEDNSPKITKSHPGLDMRKNPAIAVAVITICLLLLWLTVFYKFGN